MLCTTKHSQAVPSAGCPSVSRNKQRTHPFSKNPPPSLFACGRCHTPTLNPTTKQLLFKEDCSVDDLIDVIEGNRRYVKCLYVYNKVRLARLRSVCVCARAPVCTAHSLLLLLWLVSPRLVEKY